MLFSNQKIFLDVKDYSKIDQLEASICQFGGTIEKFLSKEVTCVVTNRARGESCMLQKAASASTCAQSCRPPTSASRVMSRGQSLLMRSNSLKDTSLCEPVAFAETWGIKIVALDTVVQAIDRQLQMCSPSSPDVMKRRKYSGSCVKEKAEPKSWPFITKFSGAFIKFEDMESNFRPFFLYNVTLPQLDLEGNLSNGIFTCNGNVQPVAVRKNAGTTASGRKQKAWTKRGYCECCDTMYDELSQHLASTEHRRFAEQQENFADLDKLIDQITTSDVNAFSLPAVDSCRQLDSNTLCTDCSTEQLPCDNVASSHGDALSPQNPQSERSAESDKVASVVDNCKESPNVSEETVKNSRSPLYDDVDRMNDQLRSPTAEVVGTTFAVDVAADCHVTREALCKEMSANSKVTNSDDMPQFISSDCVVNLLELLSSAGSAHHVEAAESETGDVNESSSSVTPVTSLELPCVPAASRNDIIVCDLSHQQTVANSSTDEYCFLSMTPWDDLLNEHCTEAPVEEHSAIDEKSQTVRCEQAVDDDLGNLSDMLASLSADAATVSNGTDDGVNHSDSMTSCYDAEAGGIGQPITCAATEPAQSEALALPLACSPLDGASLFGDYCSLIADSFSLHDQLLTMTRMSDVADHNIQHTCSSVSHPRSDDPFDASLLNNNNNTSLCLPMTVSPELCATKDTDPLVQCNDDGSLRTPVHSHADTLENPATFSPYNNISTELGSSFDISPVSGFGSTDVNDSLPRSELPRSVKVDSVSDECCQQHNRDLQTTSHDAHPCDNSDTELTEIHNSLPGSRDSADTPQLDRTLVNNSSCCIDPFGPVMPAFTTVSVQPEVRSMSSDVRRNTCDNAEPEEVDTDSDSASTVVYSQEHASDTCLHDENETETTGDFGELSVSGANSTWKVKSFVDCRMKLVRSDAVFPSLLTENNNVKNQSWSTHHDSRPLDKADASSLSTVEYSCDCPSSCPDGRCFVDQNESETRDPSVSNGTSTWQVISFVDCRMRLVRSNMVFPALFRLCQ